MVVFSLGSFLVAAGVVFVRDTLGVWEMPGVVWWKYFYTSLPYILSCLPWLALVKVISKMYDWSGGRWGIQVEELFFCFSDAISDSQAAIHRWSSHVFRNLQRNPQPLVTHEMGKSCCLFRPAGNFMGVVFLFPLSAQPGWTYWWLPKILVQLEKSSLVRVVRGRPSLSTVNQCLGRLHGAFGMYVCKRMYM